MALGAECSTDSSCSDPAFNHCEMSTTGGYCTSTGCSEGECSGGYACDTSASPSVCRRPPNGLGKSCTSASDCAGTEATFCDTFMAHACLVANCSLEPNNCFTGYECCDLSPFGVPAPLCVPTGACPT